MMLMELLVGGDVIREGVVVGELEGVRGEQTVGGELGPAVARTL
jgi:hypothetical protein